SCRRRTARRRRRAGSAARAPRPSRCACGTRRASSRRRSGAGRGRASAWGARAHRLEDFRGVAGALGRTGADDRVQLVDEDDDLAGGVRDLLEYGLQPLLELAPVLRAGEQAADVERPDALPLQRLGDVAGDDSLREPFDDRGLADAGLADQDGIVLRPAREHLDDAADLLVAADDRVELPGPRRVRWVPAALPRR